MAAMSSPDAPASACGFCRIIAGEADAHVVFEDGATLAFLDRTPLFAGHTLVVPRRHAVTLDQLDAIELSALFTVVQRCVAAFPAALGCQGTFVATNNIVSQSVPHVHVHVVPRSKGDGLRGFFWPRMRYGDGEAAAVAARIRDGLGA